MYIIEVNSITGAFQILTFRINEISISSIHTLVKTLNESPTLTAYYRGIV